MIAITLMIRANDSSRNHWGVGSEAEDSPEVTTLPTSARSTC